MAEDKDKHSEIERMRRLLRPIHEVNPSRMKRILDRLASLKKKNAPKQAESEDVA
jgi:hypothetical protein